jgi:hypothetical protein
LSGCSRVPPGTSGRKRPKLAKEGVGNVRTTQPRARWGCFLTRCGWWAGGPTELSKRSWWAVLKRTVREFGEDNLSDWAAALTYYSVLSIFPAVLVLTAVLGLLGPSATQTLIDNINTMVPGQGRDVLLTAIRELQHSQGLAGPLAIVGLVGALWSASGYIGAFMRASNAIYEMPEGRPVWKTVPLRGGSDPRVGSAAGIVRGRGGRQRGCR